MFAFSRCVKLLLTIFLASSALCLTCYKKDRYIDMVDVIHHQKFCWSFYVPEERTVTLGGHYIHTNSTAKVWNTENGEDCRLEKMVSFEEEYNMYVCLCLTDRCNWPFSYKEFAARNFSIKAKAGEQLLDSMIPSFSFTKMI
ncbi:Protein CBG16804 [Caenorhabditis briggsae]|uniref:Protein CBG16804 n=2 Tax=Caenorhabditis briggsae TaxID=6238 RepID=A8XPU5_CAEBR|nr:Protein CBG16804 [Caenorhabditis briggsae]ULT83268.1 hypothetical protein L3Y34_012486 [Caenorhabditis briggsae]CAP34671.1 Protein CBG16804 [Caenorhabditis briggsae]